MARKPYHAKQANDWYLKNTFFKFYMLRELTSVPVAIAALNLFWGIAALAGSLQAWQSWIEFQRHPLVLVINLIAIVAAWYNSLKWFEAMPKAMRIQRGTKFVADKIMITGSWIVFAGIFVVLAIIVAVFA